MAYTHDTVRAAVNDGGIMRAPSSPNCQQTTFVVGKLLLVSLSHTAPGFRLERLAPPSNLRWIYPVGRPFEWPVGEPYDEDGVHVRDTQLASYLMHRLAELDVRIFRG